jgi:hypothetical protein
MSFLKKLFGGGSKGSGKAEVIEHEGYRITPQMMSAEGGQYRLCAIIEREVDGEVKRHKLIRADTFSDAGQAANAAVDKAKQVIREQGERIFK